MREFSFMIKPASSLCNLKCIYCFNEDIASNRCIKSYGIMSPKTTLKIISNIYNSLYDGDHVNFIFQGGEPTLAGLDYFKFFTDVISKQNSKVTVSYIIQTNGTLLDENWLNFLKKHNFFIGLSIDGIEETHNFYRTNKNGQGSYSQLISVKNMIEENGLQYNILCTLTNNLSKDYDKLLGNILKENLKFIQFIPCLKNLHDIRRECDLTPINFFEFYKHLFQKWKKELEKGNYVSIKLFDDIINLFLLNKVTSCGFCGKCQLQYIIEADGSVFPCDFYTLDKYCGGNLTESSLKIIEKTLIKTGFLSEEKNLPTICSKCKYISFCQGGCKRILHSSFIAKENLEFCAYQNLLDEILEDLCNIGRILV